MTTTGILVSLLALALGAFLGFLAARRQADGAAAAAESQALADARLDAQTARAEASRAREEAATVRSELAAQAVGKAELRTAAVEAERQVALVRAELAGVMAERSRAEAERDAALKLTEDLRADRKALEDRFRLLSEESLEAQGAKADKVAEQRMAATQQLVAPLAESLKSLTERLNQVEQERARMAAELGQQVKEVSASGESIRKEALALANALRRPQVRGAWGEQTLRRVAEVSGMVQRCDFDDQTTYTGAEGDRLRPDMRVNLPDDRVVFVDAKVPLEAVLDAYAQEEDTLRAEGFSRFGKHVRGHIDKLAAKSYWQLDLRSPDFVVLFLGSDEFLRLALEHVPDLHDHAARNNVVLASPSLLIPLLRTIAFGWRQSELAESAADVIKLGRELFDRLVTMGNHVDKLGRSITASVKAYNSAISSLETRVMVSARRFNDLKVSESELKKLAPVDEPVREAAVPELIAYEEQRQGLAELNELAKRTPVELPELEAQGSVTKLAGRAGAGRD